MTDNNEALQALDKIGYWYERGCEDLALECEEKVRKALQADQWQSLNTCPYDTPVLFLRKDGNVVQDFWYDSKKPYFAYTHWMHLPEPPKEKGG